MSETTMIERVARVVFDITVGAQHWDNEWYAEERAGCFVIATAVLKAMREPTDLIVCAFYDADTDKETILVRWAAAIDRALSESP